jgi:hypothetical protein
VRAQQRARTGEEQRKVSAARDELTILVETGKGRFHTELGKLQAAIRKRVQQGLITTESQLIDETRAAYHSAGRITNTVVNDSELDTVLISNLGAQSETYEQTRRELARSHGLTTVSEESIEESFREHESKKDGGSDEASAAANLIVLALAAYLVAVPALEILSAEAATAGEEAVRVRIADELRVRIGDEVRVRIVEEIEENVADELAKETLKRMIMPR